MYVAVLCGVCGARTICVSIWHEEAKNNTPFPYVYADNLDRWSNAEESEGGDPAPS